MTYKQVQYALERKQGCHQHKLKQIQYSSVNSMRMFHLEDLKERPPEYGYELKFFTPGPFFVTGITQNQIKQSNSIAGVVGDMADWTITEYFINSNGLNLIYLPCSNEVQSRAAQYYDEICSVCKSNQSRQYSQLLSRYATRLYEDFQCHVIVSGNFQAWNNVSDTESDLVVSNAEKIWLLTIANGHKNTKGIFYYQNHRPPYREVYQEG